MFGIAYRKVQSIKNCLIFSGYQTINAFIKLEREDEVKKMFEFGIMMKDIVEDREKMFGIFAIKPESIMILPCLKPVFEKFVQGVKKLKDPLRNSNNIKAKTKLTFKTKQKAWSRRKSKFQRWMILINK